MCFLSNTVIGRLETEGHYFISLGEGCAKSKIFPLIFLILMLFNASEAETYKRKEKAQKKRKASDEIILLKHVI